MSIRSENNKIMLKIESMASRNERLVNISRKSIFLNLYLNEIVLEPHCNWLRLWKRFLNHFEKEGFFCSLRLF